MGHVQPVLKLIGPTLLLSASYSITKFLCFFKNHDVDATAVKRRLPISWNTIAKLLTRPSRTRRDAGFINFSRRNVGCCQSLLEPLMVKKWSVVDKPYFNAISSVAWFSKSAPSTNRYIGIFLVSGIWIHLRNVRVGEISGITVLVKYIFASIYINANKVNRFSKIIKTFHSFLG